jgi:NADH-quinone oxidoreductase subunit L
MSELVWLVPLFPLLGFITIVSLLASGSILMSFIIVLSVLFSIISGSFASKTIDLFQWIGFGNIHITFSFLIDPLSITMMTIITGVGFLIHVYSAGYMSHDEGVNRYFAYLNLFVFSMLLLVMGSNYIVMFAGWEGVGFCSYMLIGFWYKNHNYNNAAKKAFIMNRIGDLGFILGIFLIYVNFGSFEYNEVFSKASNGLSLAFGTYTIITLLLFVGAMGKSAQIPLYTWLPDAMAGPTPVSALIHAATMVTAGIYMIVRSNLLFSLAPFSQEIILIIGLSTALFAATIGLFQNDIKKVLAYSTVSQLGFMFFALGMGAYSTALFHVLTHAFFKALLFLGAGSVIHAMSGEQDIRYMGGLKKTLPVTFYTFLIGSLAIAGIPPLAGFFSKDEILATAFEHSPLLWGFGLSGALMTAFYMFRLLFLTFFGEFRGTAEQKHHLHESPSSMTIPLSVLAVFSVVAGWIGIPHVLGGHNWFKNFISSVIIPVGNTAHELSHSTELLLMSFSVIAVLIVIGIAYYTFVIKQNMPVEDTNQLTGIRKVIYNKYYIDEIYDACIVIPLHKISSFASQTIENKLIDKLVNGIGNVTNKTGDIMKHIQDGSISFYLTTMVIGIIFILLFNTVI